jgi:cytochrome c oxidase cbb3-type subunit I/II
MLAYPFMLTNTTDFDRIQKRVDAMAMLGVPYGDAIDKANQIARDQAAVIAADIQKSGGPAGLADKEITALVAYLERLGTDIRQPAAVTPAPAAPRPGGD